jgi:hypothetical protein
MWLIKDVHEKITSFHGKNNIERIIPDYLLFDSEQCSLMWLHRSNQCYGATVKSSRGDAIVQGRKVDATSIDATLPSHFCRRITSIVRLMGWCWPLRCEIAGQ